MGEQDKIRFFEKLARMVMMGVPYDQIGQVFNLTKGRISQIVTDDPLYLEISQRVNTEEFEKFDSLNQGWDAVESLSIAHVVTSLKVNPDPDFALRAATLANKAQRRGAYNRPIGVPNQERMVRLSLQQTFVDKLHAVSNVQVNQMNGASQPASTELKGSSEPQGNGKDKDVRPAITHQPARSFNFGGLKQKDVNFLNPSQVHKLLDPSTENKNQFSQALEDVAIADALPA